MITNGLSQVSNRLRADELNIILKGENAVSYFKISFYDANICGKICTCQCYSKMALNAKRLRDLQSD